MNSLLWYAIYIKPHKAEYAEMNLKGLGIEVYNPKYRKKTWRQGKPQFLLRQLFPNYIFARFSLNDNYRNVKYAKGVVRIIGNGDIPIPVDDGIIETIRSHQDGEYVVIKPSEFKEGEKVEIHDGPFAGFRGIFERELKDSERVIILLDAISFSARVEIQKELITRAA